MHTEKNPAQLPPSSAAHETTVIYLVDTSDDTQQQPQLTVDPNCIFFGQAIFILSSDLQESRPSFHKASVHSSPNREDISAQISPMDCSPSISSNNPDNSEYSPGDRGNQEPSQDPDS